MPNQVSPGPEVRSTFIEALTEEFYLTQQIQMRSRLRHLVEENSDLHKNSQDCFLFRNTVFEMPGRNTSTPYPRPMNLLHNDLRNPMLKWVADSSALEDEINQLKGSFKRMVTLTSSPDDFLEMLPTPFHETVERYRRAFNYNPRKLSSAEVQQFKNEHGKYMGVVTHKMLTDLIVNG